MVDVCDLTKFTASGKILWLVGDLTLRTFDALSGKNGRHLLFSERIAFDRRCAANRFDAIELTKAYTFGTLHDELVAFKRRGNVHGAETLDMYTPLVLYCGTPHYVDYIHPEAGAQRVIAETTAAKILK